MICAHHKLTTINKDSDKKDGPFLKSVWTKDHREQGDSATCAKGNVELMYEFAENEDGFRKH